MKDYSQALGYYEWVMKFLIYLQTTAPYHLMLDEKTFVRMGKDYNNYSGGRYEIEISVDKGDYSIADFENSWKNWQDVLSNISKFKSLFTLDERGFYNGHIYLGYKIGIRERNDITTKIMEINRRLNYPNITLSSDSGGCYVATAVYGSYDCPEVWTLRRFRDKTLAETWYGRAFIRLYYAISPTLVKYFGKTKWFQRLFRKPLDGFVKKLNVSGFEDTPYDDKIY